MSPAFTPGVVVDQNGLHGPGDLHREGDDVSLNISVFGRLDEAADHPPVVAEPDRARERDGRHGPDQVFAQAAGPALARISLGVSLAPLARSDEIARRAKVSNPKIYRHFADKQALYANFIRTRCASQAAQVFAIELDGADIRADLTKIARSYVDLIFSPAAMSIFRVSLAEAQRFPELGRVFHESGPARGVSRLSQFLAAAVGRGVIRIDDVETAAHQFIELCKAEYFYKVQLGVIPNLDERQKDVLVRKTVTTLLKASEPVATPSPRS